MLSVHEAQTVELVNSLPVSESTCWKAGEKAKKVGAGSMAVQTLLAGPWLGMHALPSIAEGYSTSLVMPHCAMTC